MVDRHLRMMQPKWHANDNGKRDKDCGVQDDRARFDSMTGTTGLLRWSDDCQPGPSIVAPPGQGPVAAIGM
jgi:hypothetical protein